MRSSDQLTGRRAAREAIDGVVADSGWLVLEGPPGCGTSALLEALVASAGRQGRTTALWRGERPGQAAAAVALDHAQAVTAATVAALDEAEVVVAAVRAGMPVADPGALAALRARARTLRLEPLGSDDVAAILAAAGAPGTAAEAIAERTGGHTLTCAHLAAALAGGAATLDEAEAAILPALGAYWAAQLAQIGEPAPALAEALLVLGDDAPLWAAAELAGVERAEAARLADALAAAGLLAATDPLRTASPIAWRALDAAAPKAARAQGHLEAARLLGRTPDGLDRAAEHLLAIPPSGEVWAAELLRDAASAATAAGRNDVAVARLERALGEPVPRPLRRELLVELGGARDRAGAEGAHEAYRQALRLASTDEQPAIHLHLGRSLYGAGDYRGAGLELDRALSLVDAESDIAVELVAAYVAAARFDSTLEDAAARHLAPILDRSEGGRTAAERALLAELALERGIRAFPRPTVVGLALRAWADGLLLEGADPYGISISQVAAALTWSDAFADSDRVLGATIEWAEQAGAAQVAATARYLRAWPRYYLGALQGAEADVREALAAPGWEMYEPSARAILGHVLIERGAPREAWEALTMADPEPWIRTVPYAMLLETRSRLHVQSGNLAAAAADLTDAGALLDSMGNRSPFCPWRSRLGYVTARQGDLDAGRAHVDAELEQAQGIGTPRAIGFALHARGLIDHMAERDGIADLTAAAEALGACDAKVEHARALTSLGGALAAAGRRSEARHPLREALALATAIGAVEVAERAGRELRAAGGRLAPTDGAAAPAGLTASELRVARLAARNLTNREIAEDLVVSTHTVRFHLGGIYRKLRITTRDEIGPALRALDRPDGISGS